VERFAPDALSAVIDATEAMGTAECDALARFMEVRADKLARHLSNLLPTAGASATLIIARTLAAAGQNDAIPTLLNALRDTHQQGDPRALADVLAGFGDALVEPLSRAIKSNPDDEHLTLALVRLNHVRPDTLDQLAGDRSKHLRRAAKRARQQVG